MKNCQNLNSTYFELVNLIVKLNLLTRKDNRQKHNIEVAQTFLIH
jgi:hypothetical protein